MTTARSVRRSTSTFKPRRRRLSEGRRADLARWMATWGIETTGPPLEWSSVFAEPVVDPGKDVVLDIGFGHGESVLDLARRCPERGVIGIEVHTPGVATVLEAVEREGLGNVRMVHGDALSFLERIPVESVVEVRVLFPDPWPKERQQHRRLIRSDVVAALGDRLRVGGVLRMATDVEGYAAEMIGACNAEPRFEGGPIAGPADRPITRFEQRGIDEGRHTTDLRYERIA